MNDFLVYCLLPFSMIDEKDGRYYYHCGSNFWAYVAVWYVDYIDLGITFLFAFQKCEN